MEARNRWPARSRKNTARVHAHGPELKRDPNEDRYPPSGAMEKGWRERPCRDARAKHVRRPDGRAEVRGAPERVAHRPDAVIGARGVGELRDQEGRLQRDVVPESSV